MESDELREHMEHASSVFDRKVAVTMAVVAAILAWVTLLSHRAHNETIILQSEANRAQTQANIFHTRASDQWNYFQAKNIRNYETQAFLQMLQLMPKATGADASKNAAAVTSQWSAQLKRYETELPQLKQQAESLASQAHKLEKTSEERLKESHATHDRADRYDAAELAVEIALVLCSLAVLSKRAPFWYSGMAICAIGLAVAVSGLMMK